MAEPLVAVSGLAKDLGGHTVIAGVSLELYPGTVAGLVGANGGGKTTTLRMLAGLIRPDRGEGHVLGRDIRKGRPNRREIGYMSQRSALYPELTVAENLSLRARIFGLALDEAKAAIERFGLAPHAQQRFGNLSGGWQRRAQFAAAVLPGPRLLLLDEPTAGLDVVAQRQLWSWIEDFAKRARCAIVVSTHELAEAERLPLLVLFDRGKAQPAVSLDALREAYGVAGLADILFEQACSA